MYKALDQEAKREIIILAPEWQGRLAELRQMAAQNRLVCQGCRQPVRVRAGRWRRRHFAHKHLAGCTYGLESPAILAARAILYQRLAASFPGRVNVEKKLESSKLPRTVDCWVESSNGSAIAYWIIDARMKLETRQLLLTELTPYCRCVHWVLVAALLDIDAKRQNYIRLAPTERDFLQTSQYDSIGMECKPPHMRSAPGQTLHYLDANTEILITYRGLEKIHAPNVFTGRREEHSLAEVAIDPDTGEFIHPGEIERLMLSRRALAEIQAAERQAEEKYAQWRRQQMQAAERLSALQQAEEHQTAERQAAIQQAQQRYEQWRSQLFQDRPAIAPTQTEPHSTNPGSPDFLGKQEYPCIICGALTSDWWTTFVQNGIRVCKCRECLKLGQK